MAKRPTKGLLPVVLVGAVLLLVYLASSRLPEHVANRPSAAPGEYLFCFWNVENLFDNHDDHRKGPGDKEYDPWFAHDPKAFQLKLARLCEALLRLNDGRGPDILAVVEVEGVRAADALRQALNERLSDPALHYQHLLAKDLSGGRHIAPAILTRLPVRGDRTRLHGSRLRILEGHIDVAGQDLVVIASHWTSRVSDEEGEGRTKYGDQIYGVYRGMVLSNPDVAFLVCGDFNDPPDAPSVVEHLHAVPFAQRDRPGGPWLVNLFAGKDPSAGYGTLYHDGKWYTFDQVVVSPAMLRPGAGWKCLPESVRVENSLTRPEDKKHRPWRFGGPNDKGERGYSDHFPVTVRLKVGEGR